MGRDLIRSRMNVTLGSCQESFEVKLISKLDDQANVGLDPKCKEKYLS